jgi:hypothetical protein
MLKFKLKTNQKNYINNYLFDRKTIKIDKYEI